MWHVNTLNMNRFTFWVSYSLVKGTHTALTTTNAAATSTNNDDDNDGGGDIFCSEQYWLLYIDQYSV